MKDVKVSDTHNYAIVGHAHDGKTSLGEAILHGVGATPALGSVAAGTTAALGDRSLTIPEAGNGVPDLLDEARFELEWLLKMQVPDGKPLAGMAHHKMHDSKWTELGTPPVNRDELLRHLDGALARADSLRLDFAVASLRRVRTEALRQ